MTPLQPIIDEVNVKTALALAAVQEFADAGARVAQAIKSSLEVVAKWGVK